MTRVDLICGGIATVAFCVLLSEIVRGLIAGRRERDEPFADARDITGRLPR